MSADPIRMLLENPEEVKWLLVRSGREEPIAEIEALVGIDVHPGQQGELQATAGPIGLREQELISVSFPGRRSRICRPEDVGRVLVEEVSATS